MKIAVQCDFDGTITEGEISHLLLGEFARGDWRSIVDEFVAGRMPVMECMEECFAMVHTGEAEMINFLRRNSHVVMRHGFKEFHDYYREQGHRLLVVSNGVVFYIKYILGSIGLGDIEIRAASSEMRPDGLRIVFNGPDGKPVRTDFNEVYTKYLENEGYRVVSVGDSISDVITARRAAHVFATGTLVDYCRNEGLTFTPFQTFGEVVRGMEALSL